MKDQLQIATELVKLQLTARRLLEAVDALDGIAEISYREAKDLAFAADALRVVLGDESKIAKSVED